METITLTGSLTDRDGEAAGRCAIDRALAVVGTRSAMLLLREALYGTRRFDDFAQRVGISQPIAAARLRELVDGGLLTRRPYQEPGHRTRSEYELTEKGRDFATVLLALLQWGNRWEAPTGASTQLTHTGCGDLAATELRCGRGHSLGVEDLQLGPGPHSPGIAPVRPASTD